MARKRSTPVQSGFTILVVDDQNSTLTSVKVVLEREGHEVLLADSGTRALELFAEHRVDLLLVDYFMPKMTGDELVGRIRTMDRDVQIVLQTGYSGEKPPREMLRSLDIPGYHDKTEGPDKLLLWVEIALKACGQIRRVREVEILKSQLLANVSHEFRTPLNVILGYTEVLEEELSELPSAVDTLKRVHANAEALFRLVDDFLRLADLDAAVVTSRDLELLSWEAIGTDVRGLARELGHQKHVELVWQAPEGGTSIIGNTAMLRIILRNLLSNAFKFTDHGSVTITGSQTDSMAILDVEDTGVGIPEHHHEKIFDAFHQVDGSATRTHEGTGIGLTIARKLARLMGGDLKVASRPNAGTTFSLHLRRSTNDASAAPAEPPAPEPSSATL